MDDDNILHESILLHKVFEPDSPGPLADQDNDLFRYSYNASTKQQREALSALIEADGYSGQKVIDFPIHELWHQESLIGCILSNEGVYDCGDRIDLQMSIELVFIAAPWRGNNLSTFLMYYFSDRTLAALASSKDLCHEKDINKLGLWVDSDYYSVGGELFVKRFFNLVSFNAEDMLMLDNIRFEADLDAGW